MICYIKIFNLGIHIVLVGEYEDMISSMRSCYETLRRSIPDHPLVILAELMPSGGFSFSNDFWERKYPEEDFPTQNDAFRAYVSDLELAVNSL